MERRYHERTAIEGSAPVQLLFDGRPSPGVLSEVSLGGARLRLSGAPSTEVENAIRTASPCRLSIENVGALRAVPRWLGRGDGEAFTVGASLGEPEGLSAPVAPASAEAVPDASMVPWIRFFSRRALLAHLGRRPDEARRARRQALQLAASFIERGLQRFVVCGGEHALVEPEGVHERLEVVDDLERLGVWMGAPNAAVTAAMLRVVVHLACVRGRDLAASVSAYETLARGADAPVLRWSAGAVAAIAETRVRTRRAAAAAALASRDFRGIVEPAEGFPAPSFVGVVSAALAVFSGGGTPSSRRRRRPPSRRSRHEAPPSPTAA